MVIGRLEEETASSREECERAAEARVKRIRDKYEAELREVERSERQTLEKFNTMKVSHLHTLGTNCMDGEMSIWGEGSVNFGNTCKFFNLEHINHYP